MNDAAREFAAWLRREDGFTLIAHVSPDGDTIGSCLALHALLRGLGKRTELVCEHIVPYLYAFLPGAEAFRTPEESSGTCPHVIAVDCASQERMGSALALFERAAQTGNIDHHRSNEQFGTHVLHDTGAAATAELVFAVWQALGEEFSQDIRRQAATCLFAGISTDTGNFSYANVTADTFRICASLMKEQFDLADINRRIYRTVSIGKTRLKGFVLNSLELHAGGKIATAVIMQQDLARLGAVVEDIEGMVDGLRDIDTVEIAMLLRERKDGGFKASLRSKEYADVSAIADAFDGGGHLHAAGCNFEGTLQAFHAGLLLAAQKALR